MKKFALAVLVFVSMASIASKARADENTFVGGWVLDSAVENPADCELGLYISKDAEEPGLIVRYNNTTFSVDMTWKLGTTNWGNHEYSDIVLEQESLSITEYTKHLSGKEVTSVETLEIREQDSTPILKKTYNKRGSSPREQVCTFVQVKG